MDTFVLNLIAWLQTFSAETLSLLTFFICAISILALLRGFGDLGLCVYNALAIVIANIQVLRLADFNFAPEPLALGTIVFSTTFLVSDILTEHYGTAAARKSLWLSFIAQILVTIWMVITLGHPAITYHEFDSDLSATFAANDQALLQVFTPSLRILLASLLAYMISQLCDIWLFQKIRTLSHGRFIWLRQNLSTALSGLLDNFSFGLIAWIILSPTPISLSLFASSFVFASYLLRAAVNVAGTPIMYLSYQFLPKTYLPSSKPWVTSRI